MKATKSDVGMTGKGAMLLVIPVSLWDTLVSQGEIEGRSPGAILTDALSSYLDDDVPTRASGEIALASAG